MVDSTATGTDLVVGGFLLGRVQLLLELLCLLGDFLELLLLLLQRLG